ncbi:MAG TPA: alpha/beta hydrolase [Chthoniobacteraceae bacterium]|jgi:acetyl esterase/lipase|nr:alpha/beta hydrolase [Chthoniobacteraceae bacterium]
MKILPVVLAITGFLPVVLSAQTSPASGAGDAYAKSEAHLKAYYAAMLPKLPAGTVKIIDQSYVDQEKRGIDPSSSQKLDLFVPPGDGPFPLVVNIHGGGWHAGGKEGGIGMAMTYIPKGFALASITYRWVQDAPFPAQIDDCNAALAWLRAHAAEYHLDPDKIGVSGHSAGAHLCALIAATGDTHTFKNAQKVQAAVCYSGPFDMDRDRGNWPHNSFLWNPRDKMMSFFPGGNGYDATVARQASPETYVHAGMPPILIFNGDQDRLVPTGQAQVFANDLKKAGVDVTFHLEPGKDHGTAVNPQSRAEALAFFQKNLQSK